MSNNEVCRECEYNSVDDAVLCHDCAEFNFLELMRIDADARWSTFIGEYACKNAAEMDKYSSDIFEAWIEFNPEKAGKLMFALFDAELEKYRMDGEL
jgi:hypothetical protein